MTQKKQSATTKRKPGRPVDSPAILIGLANAARMFGYSASHIRAVILGERQCPQLVEALKNSGHPLSKHIAE